MTSNSPRTASVATTTGRFDFEHDFHHPTRVLWTAYDGKAGTSTWLEGEEPVIGRGYGNEVVEVQRCLRAGALTSELAPPARSVSLARQMDDLLAQVGVAYDD